MARSTPPVSAEKGKNTKLGAPLLRDIRDAAAFLALMHIYRDKGVMPNVEKAKEMERQFWGDEQTNTASTLDKVLDGSEAFANIYESIPTDEGMDRVLKKHTHGTAAYYVSGVDFDGELLSRKAFTIASSGRITGRSLISAAEKVLKNNKKAVAKMRVLKGKVVHMNKRGEVTGYASGKKEIDLLKYINDGMYVELQKKEKETIDVEKEGSTPSSTTPTTSPTLPALANASTTPASEEEKLDDDDVVLSPLQSPPPEPIEYTEEEIALMATFGVGPDDDEEQVEEDHLGPP